MGLSGLAYLVQGWVVGSEGFSRTETIAIVLAFVLDLAWMIWLVVVAWRMEIRRPRRLADEGVGRRASPGWPQGRRLAVRRSRGHKRAA
jgi:hypothetical protein